jgi:exonuclease 3'-5' domain-containing protein 1
LVSSTADLVSFLNSIAPSSSLYLDLEGKNLSRNGTLSLVAVLVYPTRRTSIIDVQTLEKSAFSTPNANGKTLKTIFEDPLIPKYFWDVRNDSDALFSHYQIRLAGVTDVQLLENASRADDKTYLHGLEKCVRMDLSLGFMERERWIRTKKEVQALMPNDIFSRRPLDDKTMQYCVNDVEYLPALRDVYSKRIKSEWREKAMDQSARRVVEACNPAYNPQSEAKKLGPWGTGSDKKLLTMDDWLDQLDSDRMDATQADQFGYDEDDEYDDQYEDDYPTGSNDATWDDTFDSCWDRN